MKASIHDVQIQGIFKDKNENITKYRQKLQDTNERSVTLSNGCFDTHVIFSVSEIFEKLINSLGY